MALSSLWKLRETENLYFIESNVVDHELTVKKIPDYTVFVQFREFYYNSNGRSDHYLL